MSSTGIRWILLFATCLCGYRGTQGQDIETYYPFDFWTPLDDEVSPNATIVRVEPSRVMLVVNEKAHINISLSATTAHKVRLTLNVTKTNVLHIRESLTLGGPEGNLSQLVWFRAKRAIANLIVHPTCNVNESKGCGEVEIPHSAFTRIFVVHSRPLTVVIAVVGWIYFAAWTVSFWPQIYLNFKRKSVVGLDFNFLALNTLGFACYFVFNCTYRWSPVVKAEHFRKNPFGINPVQLNDVAFSLHALAACLVNVVQCIIYDRGYQRLSRICMGIMSILGVFIVISLILGLTHTIDWLMFVQFLSYVKLAVTLIKYFPQAFLNFRRRSTEGWSIENVLLDFTGGSFSIAQMFIIAYNSDDWSSLFADFTKFGLGLFSILFDLLFMFQHYVLYRGRVPYDVTENEPVTTSPTSDSGEHAPYVTM